MKNFLLFLSVLIFFGKAYAIEYGKYKCPGRTVEINENGIKLTHNLIAVGLINLILDTNVPSNMELAIENQDAHYRKWKFRDSDSKPDSQYAKSRAYFQDTDTMVIDSETIDYSGSVKRSKEVVIQTSANEISWIDMGSQSDINNAKIETCKKIKK